MGVHIVQLTHREPSNKTHRGVDLVIDWICPFAIPI